MKRKLIAIFALTTGLLSMEVLAQDATADRIGRIERGLVPPVQINNGPVWTLDERMAHYRVPGVSLAVIHRFKIDWAKQYGARNAKTGEVVTETTLFQAASITKSITAAVALKLVQDGVLDLDRDINKQLKSWKVPENEWTRVEKVTLRRLLSHSAGLTVHGFMGYAEDEPAPTILQVLDGKQPANSAPVRVDMKPGSGFRYSGGGYTVLQLLIEDVTGRPLAELAEEMVFKPAGMRNSSIRSPLPESLAKRASLAHMEDGIPKQGHQFLAGGSGCCGLWTTPSDLAQFAIAVQRALRGDSSAMLTRAMAKKMLTPTNSDSMGLGFFLERRGTTVYFSHGGSNPGFTNYLIGHLNAGYGAAVMTNGRNGYSLALEIVRSIAKEYGWKNYQPENYASRKKR